MESPYMLSSLAELVRYRELIKNLVSRDLKVRYRNSALGFIWCLLNTLLMMGVFAIGHWSYDEKLIAAGVLFFRLHVRDCSLANAARVGNENEAISRDSSLQRSVDYH